MIDSSDQAQTDPHENPIKNRSLVDLKHKNGKRSHGNEESHESACWDFSTKRPMIGFKQRTSDRDRREAITGSKVLNTGAEETKMKQVNEEALSREGQRRRRRATVPLASENVDGCGSSIVVSRRETRANWCD
ncbi:LOW QUALITY PROTEIN: hypothetical protein YC2023_080669 [Brassica napus]